MNDCSWPACDCDHEGIDSPPCRADYANEQDERLALAGTLRAHDGDDGPIAPGWVLSVGNGHDGMGVYAYMEEYPEEGSFLLEPLGSIQQDAYAEGRQDEREQCAPLASDLPVGTMTARDGCTETQWNERRNTLMDGKYLIYVARVTR